ncbi:MAG: hypothetical protein K5746_07820, partial [Clostridiales bacterium]|nr:hypothetical protein [Clostridiales bacterium]
MLRQKQMRRLFSYCPAERRQKPLAVPIRQRVPNYYEAWCWQNRIFRNVLPRLQPSADTIIDKYHGLTRIEDQFREMKGTLETRPIWVNTPEHIQAHLMICFMALT